MRNKLFNHNFIGSIYNKFINLLTLFVISLNFNRNKSFNLKFSLLFLTSLIAAILIRSNLITHDLFYNILFNNNSIFLYYLLIGLIYLSLIYVTILIIRLLKRIFYSYKNVYQFIIYYKNGTKDIKTIMSFYYFQNILFISLSLFIIYNILNKLYYLLNENINLTIFILTSVIFMIILVYNLFLIVKDFKYVNLLSNKTLNNKFTFILLLIILIDLCYIFIFPLFIFNLLNYDKLLLFIENLDYFKANNIKLKAYYMFPHNNFKGKAKELSNTVNITSNNNQVITANATTSVTIGNSGNVINVGKSELDNIKPKASTSKLVDNTDVDSGKVEDKSDKNTTNHITNNYFTFNNFQTNLIIPEFKNKSLPDLNHFDKFNDEYFKDLFTTEDNFKKDNNLRKANYVNNFYDFKKSSNNLNNKHNYIYAKNFREFLDVPNSNNSSINKANSLNKSDSDILIEDNLPKIDNLPNITVTDIDDNNSKTIFNSSLLNNKLLKNLSNIIINNDLNNKPIINNDLNTELNNNEINNKSITNNDLEPNIIKFKVNNLTKTGIRCSIGYHFSTKNSKQKYFVILNLFFYANIIIQFYLLVLY